MGWRPRRQRRPRRPQPWRPHGDLLGAMGTTCRRRGRHGDNVDDVGMTGTTWGGDHGDHSHGDHSHGDHSHGDHMGTFWGLWGQRGDDGDDTGMMWGRRGRWGQCGDDGDNEITKNATTFEWIEIIEFRLKIWDPWTLPHTCRLQLMCRWGVSYPKWHFYPKSAPVTLVKFFFLFLHWIPLDHI